MVNSRFGVKENPVEAGLNLIQAIQSWGYYFFDCFQLKLPKLSSHVLCIYCR